jgi:hypothetical protein
VKSHATENTRRVTKKIKTRCFHSKWKQRHISLLSSGMFFASFRAVPGIFTAEPPPLKYNNSPVQFITPRATIQYLLSGPCGHGGSEAAA